MSIQTTTIPLVTLRGGERVEVREKCVTVAEAAKLLGVSRSTLRRWIDQGDLPAYRFDQRRVLVKRDDLKRLITRIDGEKGRGLTEIEKDQEQLSRRLTKQEQRKALAAIEAAERFSAELWKRREGELFSDSAEIVREMREDRSRQVS